jgi:GntR family transcriptional regulator/MocR family aminotransferase
MLFNALRLGFMVIPDRLVHAFEVAKSFIDRHPPTLEQAILAEFITDGHFGHHVRRMRQIYGERMSVLKAASHKQLNGLLDVVDAAAGMRTVGWLKTSAPDAVAALQARRLGLELSALSAFTLKHFQKPGLMLGFASCNASELRRGASVLAAALQPAPRQLQS